MSFQTWLYIVASSASVIIALILVHFARLSDQSRMSAEKKAIAERINRESTNADLERTIFEEVGTVIDSPVQSEAVSRKLCQALQAQVEKRLRDTAVEIEKKYVSTIDEKTKSEELAWDKYERVLSDKKKTEAVIHSIAEGLVVVDAKGKVMMMNPAAEKLLGVDKNHQIGKNVTDNLKDEHMVTLSHDHKGSKDREIEFTTSEDETKRILRASSAVIENENGQTVGMVSVLSDITKQRELENLKAQFVANVSHELRTPLVAIDKSIGLILSKTAGPLSAPQEQFLTIAERNLKRLTNLVNDLLDLSKLEAGKMEVKAEDLKIEQVMQEAVQAFASWAQAKSLNISMQAEENLPLVKIDSARIVQVLTNLIGNAMKFTSAGGSITLKARHLQNERMVEVGVSDTGIGISKEHIAKVFDKFYQTGERVATDMSGTGIGLSVAKEIVQLHGGKIWVESEKDVGTTFFFTVPLAGA